MTVDISLLKPKTLDGVKRLANQIKKRDGIKHCAALETAAKQAGFNTYAHAKSVLDKQATIGG